ncbi:phage tail protein, partial [Rhizobiaceae sp. 2RAB30]
MQVEIDALRQEIDRLKNAPAAADGLDGLTATVDQLKSDIATLRSAVEAGGAGDGAAVQALGTKLQEIEATVATLGAKEGG